MGMPKKINVKRSKMRRRIQTFRLPSTFSGFKRFHKSPLSRSIHKLKSKSRHSANIVKPLSTSAKRGYTSCFVGKEDEKEYDEDEIILDNNVVQEVAEEDEPFTLEYSKPRRSSIKKAHTEQPRNSVNAKFQELHNGVDFSESNNHVHPMFVCDGNDNVSIFQAPFENSYYDEQLKQYESQLTDQSDCDEDPPEKQINSKGRNVNDHDDRRRMPFDACFVGHTTAANDSLLPTRIQSINIDANSNVHDYLKNSDLNPDKYTTCLNPRLYLGKMGKNSCPTFILIVDHPSALSISGKVRIKILWGQARIHSFVLNRNRGDTYSVFSSRSMMRNVIETLPSPDKHTDNYANKSFMPTIRGELSKHMTRQKLQQTVNEVMHRKTQTVAVLFQKVNSPLNSYMKRTYPLIFEMPKDYVGITNTMVTTKHGFLLEDRVPKYIYWDSSRENVLNDILAGIRNSGMPPRIVVCGCKNLGKSTFCRYIVNSILNVCKSVSWFDCDPGRPEFTPPGVVSIVDIQEPLLGPPFSHQKTPRRMHFVGGTSVAESPVHYMTCVTKLFEYWSEDSSLCKQPLIINTMGWRRGLGVLILSEIIQLMEPTHVIQIRNPIEGRNMAEITPSLVRKNEGLASFNPPPNALHRRPLNIDYRYYKINSLIKHESYVDEKYNQHDVLMVSYFSQLHHNGHFVPLNECSCYSVPFSVVAIHVFNMIVPKSEILNVINGNVVALCECDPQLMISIFDPTLPKFLDEPPVGECFGYGIVRAVSMEQKCFYIITPVKPSVLHRVNAFLVGSGIHLPNPLLLKQTAKTNMPYLTIHKRPLPFDITDHNVEGRKFKNRNPMAEKVFD